LWLVKVTSWLTTKKATLLLGNSKGEYRSSSYPSNALLVKEVTVEGKSREHVRKACGQYQIKILS
jgi:hypothetical protein